MKLVGLVKAQTEVPLVPVSKLEVNTGTRGIPYKFAMLKSPKINTLWEPFHHFHLEYQNSMKFVDLKRGNPRLTQVVFSNSMGLKYQSCIRWNFSQLNSLKIRVFKESEVKEFQLSMLEKEMERRKKEFKMNWIPSNMIYIQLRNKI